jgi:plasmid stability protein
VRNLADEVHRAIRAQAARHGRSAEAEIREILKSAVKPQGRMKLGSLLVEVGRKARLTDDEFALLEGVREKTSARAACFE